MPGLPIGPLELVIVLVIALVVLGPGKLPDVGAALGKTIREFRQAAGDLEDAASLEPKRVSSGAQAGADSRSGAVVDEAKTPIAAAAHDTTDPEHAA
jgi:sec-independent protein translocase protein TatA